MVPPPARSPNLNAYPLGERTRSRGRPATARRASGEDAPAARNRRASLWDNQVLDGINPLPDEDAETGRHRNGLARAGLQFQTRHEHTPQRRPATLLQDMRLGARVRPAPARAGSSPALLVWQPELGGHTCTERINSRWLRARDLKLRRTRATVP